MTTDEEQLWKLRAEAMLPIVKAAIAITQSYPYEVQSKNKILVSADRYEALHTEVCKYLVLAKAEQT